MLVLRTGAITQAPNRIRDPRLPRSQRTERRCFDTEAFTRPANFMIF